MIFALILQVGYIIEIAPQKSPTIIEPSFINFVHFKKHAFTKAESIYALYNYGYFLCIKRL